MLEDNFICKILATYADESILNDKGKINYHVFKPVLFEFPTYEYFLTGEKVGDCRKWTFHEQTGLKHDEAVSQIIHKQEEIENEPDGKTSKDRAGRMGVGKWRYRSSIRSYFADHTEEGMIAKHARMREDENILKTLFHESETEIERIYMDEYRMRYGRKSEKWRQFMLCVLW